MLGNIRLMLLGTDSEHGNLRGFEVSDSALIDAARSHLHETPPAQCFVGNLEGRPVDLQPGELTKFLPPQQATGPPGQKATAGAAAT